MLQRLQSNPALAANLHRYEMGDCRAMASDCQQAVIVLTGSVEILLPSPVEEAACFCWQTLAAGDAMHPSQDIAADNFPQFWIRALVPSLVLLCSDSEFRRLLLTDHNLAADLLEAQRRRVAELRRELMRLRMPTAEGRFMHYLLSENHFDDAGQTRLKGYFHEIAMHLNLAPATLSRTLAGLQRKGHFKRQGYRLSIRKSAAPSPLQESPRARAAPRPG